MLLSFICWVCLSKNYYNLHILCKLRTTTQRSFRTTRQTTKSKQFTLLILTRTTSVEIVVNNVARCAGISPSRPRTAHVTPLACRVARVKSMPVQLALSTHACWQAASVFAVTTNCPSSTFVFARSDQQCFSERISQNASDLCDHYSLC